MFTGFFVLGQTPKLTIDEAEQQRYFESNTIAWFKMNNQHPISEEVLELVNIALSKGEHWIAYNQSLYFIDKDNVHFFKLQNEAKEFANDNLSDRDSWIIVML